MPELIRLRIGPRPKHRDIPKMGVDVVMTLQRPEEQAWQLGNVVLSAGVYWSWHPLDARKHSTTQSPPELFIQAAEELSKFLSEGKSVFVHCAAGIHRTGMVTYGALRIGGYSQDATHELIRTIRPIILVEASNKLEEMERFLTGREVK